MNSSLRFPTCLIAIIVLLLLTAASASAEPALWKIQGPHATVYIYGSVHLLKDSTQWRTAKFEKAFNSSGSLWEEIANADDVRAAEPLLMQYGVDASHPLSSKLDAAAKAKLTSTASDLGIPEEQLEPLQPWLAALRIGTAPLVRAGYDPNSGVDVFVKNLALRQGKPVRGFETIEQQIRYFADLSQALQTQFLLYSLDNAQAGPANVGALVDAWSAGDTAKLQTIINGSFIGKYPQLYDILLVQRNALFARGIEKLLEGNGTAFVAVGMGHLVGPDSVIADLARDGFSPELQ